MLLHDCHIAFNKPAFYTGEVITLLITLKINKNKPCTALTLKLECDGKCSFMKTHGSGKDRKSHLYSGHQTYFKTEKDLLADLNKSSDSELTAGDYSFNFSYALPINLPSSIEGRSGRIRYTATVKLERPYKFDLCYKVAFTVLSNIDINMYPDRCITNHVDISKTFHTFFMKTGKLVLNVKIPFSGFVPGQYIPVNLHAVNNSQIKVKELKVHLFKNMTYHATVPRTCFELEPVKICKDSGGEILGGEEKTMDLYLYVPATPSSSITFQSIITVEYELKVTAVISGMHRDLTCSLPITIGTIPFVPNNLNNEPQGPPIAPSAPPPSYEETMIDSRMDEKHEDWDHSKNYIPRYPVYNFGKN